jgi:hypothetical protein
MDDVFTKRVWAASIAGWWTVLIFYCVLVIQWLVYLFMMNKQPAAMFFLWGSGASWAQIQTLWLWGMVVFKLALGTMLFIVVWLTFWARQLAKS